MPLRMTVRENRWLCPHITCDWCGKEIADAAQAHVLWRTGADHQPLNEPPTFLHRQCDWPTSGNTYRGVEWSWQPLDAWLIYLERNLHLDRPSAKRTADHCSGLVA